MRSLLALVAALVVVPVAAAVSSETWTTHHAKAGFRIDSPSSWIDVTRLSPQVLAKVKEVPALKPYVDSAQKSKAVKLIVLDAGAKTLANHFATSFNVLEAQTTGDLRFQRDVNVAQLNASGLLTSKLQSHYVTLPAGKAVELRYRARYGTTAPEVSQLQFLLLRDGVATVLTYTTLPKLASAYEPVFLRSAHSLRFG